MAKSPYERGGAPVATPLLADLEAAADTRSSFAEEVKRVIPAIIGSEYCSAASIAKLFGITERSLQRRLALESSSFQKLLDQIRQKDAMRLLDNTGLPLSQVAARLGYSEASAFSRAFRRWEGCSPAKWRTGHLHSEKRVTKQAGELFGG